MNTVAIFCRTIDENGYPFNDIYYWHAYIDLLLSIKSKGADAYFVTNPRNYLGKGLFAKAYTTDSKVPIADFKVVENLKADVVYEKGDFTDSDVRVLNPDFVARITESKEETFRYFGKYQAQTIVCKNHEMLIEAINSISSDLIVVKGSVSHSGDDVYIGTREEVLSKLSSATYPLIAQEFLDTSIGIKGIVSGMHDLRIYIMGGKIVMGSVREPKKGEYRANTGKGGKETHFYSDKIPSEPLAIAKEIDKTFEGYDRYYSADFAHTPQGWKLIELNSKPGLDPVANNEHVAKLTDDLANYLVELANSETS